MGEQRTRARPPRGPSGPARVAAPGRPPGAIAQLQRAAGNRAAQGVLDGGGVPGAGALHPALGAAIAAARPRGRPLGSGVRGELETALGADLGAVRVHDSPAAHALSAALGADAFTTGRDIFFAAGRFDPHGAAGRRLLAHELAHVVQQGGGEPAGPLALAPPGGALEAEADAVAAGVAAPRAAAAPGAVQRQAAAAAPAPAAGREEQRTSRDAQWHVETEPASPVVPVGKAVTFRLRRTLAGRLGWRDTETGGVGAYPDFLLRDPSGRERAYRPPTDPYTIRVELNAAGRWRGTFTGVPLTPAGPRTQPFALTHGHTRIAVSLEVEAVDQAAAADWAARAATAPAREDVDRIEDPRASPGEAAVAFRRLATRRGFAVLEANRREAETLLRLYTQGEAGRPAAEALGELARVVELDDALLRELNRVPSLGELEREASAGRIRTSDELHEFLRRKRERVMLARALLAEAFPLVAAIRGPWREPFRRQPETREAVVTLLLRRILADIATTQRNLATGRLDILDAQPVVDEVRQGLGLAPGDPRAAAIDGAIAEHRSDEAKAALGLAAASLMLLFVPGIGPALAAAAGAGAAALSWERAAVLSSAAGAGVRGGLVTHEEAAAAAFWAVIDTVLVGVDVAAQLARAVRVTPHVADAGARAMRTVSQLPPAGGALAEEAAAGGRALAPLTLTAGELHTFATEVLRRPLKPLGGAVVIHDNAEALATVYRARWPKAARRPGWRPPAGFYDPATGVIHVNRQMGLMTALHEVIHRASRELFPLGRQIFGHFLDEGMTEAVVRWKLGPRLGRHGYDVQVRFVEALAARVGPELIERAVVHGDYRALRDAVKTVMFGGSEQKTFQFFALLRGVAPDTPNAYDPLILDELLDMIGAGRARPTPHPPAPGVRGGPHADPGTEGGLAPKLTPKQEKRLERWHRLATGEEQWSGLAGTEPAKMGTLFHRVIEQLVPRLFPGGRAVTRTKITPDLIATLRARRERVVLVECELPAGGRMDVAELDFRANRATIIDLTARSKVEHLAKSSGYVRELRTLTGMDVQAMDMLYVDEHGGLAETLLEVLTTQEKAK